MSKNKKFVFTSAVILIIIGIIFFFKKEKRENNIWLIYAFAGDKNNALTYKLQQEVNNLLPPGSKVILKTVSKEISNINQAEKEIRNSKAELIVWGDIKNEKIFLRLTTAVPACAYITTSSNILSLLNLKNIELTDDINTFHQDDKSLIKIFFRGYIQYLNEEYKTAISTWKNSELDNPVISFYLGNAYLLLSQSGKQTREHQLAARKSYQDLLLIVDRKTNLIFYQSILNNLGVHYLDYPFDLRGKNLEKAQACLKSAVQMSPDWSNKEYGMTLSNLTVVYENLYSNSQKNFNDLVIKNFSESLRVFREHNDRELQAITFNNLGAGYLKIQNGTKEDIKNAIGNLIKAKKLALTGKHPEIFYRIINNLGLAHTYINDTKKAAKYLTMSQDFFEEDIFPIQFGFVHENLGDILLNMQAVPDKSNLIEAAKCYKNALKTLTPDNRPLNFAQINSNLGLIYSSLEYNSKRDNLKEAESYYKNALMVLTKDSYPLQYANIINNLGNISVDLSSLPGINSTQNKSDSLDSAVNYFAESIEIYKQFRNSKELIMTKVNMANAYTSMPENRIENLSKAVSIYMDVLSSPDSKNYIGFVTNNLELARKTLQDLENGTNEFSQPILGHRD